MISNLIELGGELIQNNQEDYGFLINNDDIILQIIYNENTEKFELGDINKKEDCVFNFLEESYFKNNLPTPLNTQDITISNQNGLMGFSPFVLLFDHDFLGQKIKPERYDDEENFYEYNSERYKFRKKRSKFKVNLAIGKIKVTYEQNKNNNQFNKFIDLVFDNVDKNFLEKINMFKDSSIYIENFFNKFNSSFIKDLINQYLEFLYINSNDIIDKIIDYEMNSENRKSLRNKYLFIVCSFGDEKDLINDFFYDYCKFIKEKNENIIPYEDGFCSFCGKKGIINPNFNYLSNQKEYFFNSISSVENTRLRICKNCNSLALFALSKLENVLDVPNLMIIPQRKNDNGFEEFIKISNENCNSFKKLNNFLLNHDNYNYDLVIYKKRQSITDIKKYIENYKSFLVKFDDLKLYDENGCKYLFNEKLPADFIPHTINNIFDMETMFRNFFFSIKNDNINYLKNFYFYQIFTRDLIGDNGLLKGLNSKMVLLFYKYMDSIFSFVYELNIDSINKNMINEIVLNSLMYMQKYNKRDINGYYIFRANIIKVINYYLMFCNEFIGDKMLDKEIIEELDKYLKDDVNINKINNLINKDLGVKYFIIGQFIRQIDNFKFKNGKNSNVFSNFVNNVNKNNIKKSFSDILIDNLYYINFMNKKGKLIFEIFKSDYDLLFNENQIKYEDYILLIFIGYYTNNLLYLEKND